MIFYCRKIVPFLRALPETTKIRNNKYGNHKYGRREESENYKNRGYRENF